MYSSTNEQSTSIPGRKCGWLEGWQMETSYFEEKIAKNNNKQNPKTTAPTSDYDRQPIDLA